MYVVKVGAKEYLKGFVWWIPVIGTRKKEAKKFKLKRDARISEACVSVTGRETKIVRLA